MRVGEVRHVPVNAILDTPAGVFGRGGFQFKELAGHAHALFEIAVCKHQIIKHKAAEVLTGQQRGRDKGAGQNVALYVNRGAVVYGCAQAFCQSREVDRRLVPFAVIDALDIVEDVAAIQNG